MATRADRNEEEKLRRFVVCLLQPVEWRDESTYGVVDALQVAAGYTSHEHLSRAQIVAEIKDGVEYWTARVVRDKKGSVNVVIGARIHHVHGREHNQDWITTNPNDTTRDNLDRLRWCDEVIEDEDA
jgi:hypothetical protein